LQTGSREIDFCYEQYFIERHVIGFYPLLPTMQGATYRRLVDAIEELKLIYNNERRKLAELLLWFGTFLKRTDMVEEADKRKLEIYMNQFGSLLEENSLRGFAGDTYHSRGKLNFLLPCCFQATRPLSGVFR
jgi:hypothetical protein